MFLVKRKWTPMVAMNNGSGIEILKGLFNLIIFRRLEAIFAFAQSKQSLINYIRLKGHYILAIKQSTWENVVHTCKASSGEASWLV